MTINTVSGKIAIDIFGNFPVYRDGACIDDMDFAERWCGFINAKSNLAEMLIDIGFTPDDALDMVECERSEMYYINRRVRDYCNKDKK